MKYSNYCIWGTDQKIFFYYFNWCSSFFEWCVCGFFKKFKHWILFFCWYEHGPGRKYYPRPSKIVLIVHADNSKAGKLFGLYLGFKVYTGAHNIGSYIWDDESKRDWMKERMEMREQNIRKSEKPQENAHRKVSLRWYARSNQSGYFYNALLKIRGVHLGEWRKWFRKPFASYFLQKDKTPFTHCRRSK